MMKNKCGNHHDSNDKHIDNDQETTKRGPHTVPQTPKRIVITPDRKEHTHTHTHTQNPAAMIGNNQSRHHQLRFDEAPVMVKNCPRLLRTHPGSKLIDFTLRKSDMGAPKTETARSTTGRTKAATSPSTPISPVRRMKKAPSLSTMNAMENGPSIIRKRNSHSNNGSRNGT